jgi:hypothetical protein
MATIEPAKPAPRPRLFARWQESANDLMYEITTTAQRIVAARTSSGERVQRTEATWRLLETLERSRYCLAIADVARALGVTRQTAQPLCHAAAVAGPLLPLKSGKRPRGRCGRTRRGILDA